VLGAALHELGWIEGQNLIVERREVDGGDKLLGSLAEQLVQLKVEIIVTNGTEAALAAKNATKSIPIVMLSVGDPVRTGLVASLARPGGNITGYSIVSPESEVKRIALLRELLPTAQRIGVLVNPQNPMSDIVRQESERAYHSLGMQPIFVEVLGPEELVDRVAEVAQRQGQAMVVGADPLFMTNRVALMRAALTYALPTVVEARVMADAGALVSYHVSWWEQCRRHAAFIDRILRGAKPADLPIEQPTQFELLINLKTAKALRIFVPQTLLSRADEVIQ
jgi:putative ABC transport system substrate-binding protein